MRSVATLLCRRKCWYCSTVTSVRSIQNDDRQIFDLLPLGRRERLDVFLATPLPRSGATPGRPNRELFHVDDPRRVIQRALRGQRNDGDRVRQAL